LDQEIRNMEVIHQQVQRKKEKMARLADLQRQIDEATEEVCHLAQDEQDRRPQHRELHQEGLFNEDGWYDDFNHDTFTFDAASPLAAELQAIPWPTSYKPPQLPMYDGHSDPKQFLMSYEATISLYGGNAGQVLRHGSSQCGPDMVFLSSARDYYFVAEAQGYATNKFPRFLDKAGHSSGPVSMHARP
jgi:hypothetical protein